jgi:polyisoprenoid-binding protein YceI
MKGKTKPVTMMVTKVGEGKGPMGNYREGFEGKVTVNRLDFGVDYMPEALSKEVELTFAVEGVKKKK